MLLLWEMTNKQAEVESEVLNIFCRLFLSSTLGLFILAKTQFAPNFFELLKLIIFTFDLRWEYFELYYIIFLVAELTHFIIDISCSYFVILS